MGATTETIQLKILRPTPKEIGLAAVEVYGGGYVSQAAYESDVIELDDIGSWGEIRWSGRRDPDARVDIRTLFEGRVFDTTRPHEVRQRVIPGNAADEIESERISVTTSLSRSLVFSPEASPNPFTPNGDGINDVANISYKLLRVTSAVPVSIEVFDLAGRLVSRVYAENSPIGEYSHPWDGLDDSNELVPPGLYVYRIVADLQSRRETHSGTLAVT